MRTVAIKRVGAFLVDVFIIFMLCSLVVAILPIDSNHVMDIAKELSDKTSDFYDNKITAEEYSDQTEDLSYDLRKTISISPFVTIFMYFLYFVIFQSYNNGQTPGKMLFKIRITKEDGQNAGFISCFIRSGILYGLFTNLMAAISFYMFNKDKFLSVSNTLTYAQILLFVACVIGIILPSKKGIHDIAGGTIVVDDINDLEDANYEVWGKETKQAKDKATVMKNKHTTKTEGRKKR